jgi:TonB family protein
MSARRSIYCSLAVLLLVVVAGSSQAQMTGISSEWESLRPAGEEFTIQMPKNSTAETGTYPYHKMELNTRLYLSTSRAGPLLAVASFSGIKSNPALYSDFERFNSYVDAFKNWFPSKARGKDATAKLSLVSSNTFHGHPGREYSLTVGDLKGVVKAYSTKKRFYAVVVLNTKKDDSLQERFLSSFLLPDRIEAPKEVVAQGDTPGTPSATTATRSTKPNGEAKKPETDADAAVTQAKPAGDSTEASNQPSVKKAPISGGVLNGKAIYLPLPEMPPGDASGMVMVQVMVDEQGAVVDARAVSGPPSLQAAAINAARLARFSPTTLMGEPVKVTGMLTFNFVR